MKDMRHEHQVADLLTAIGELAAELEETTDPARETLLRTQLTELDKVLDHLLSQTQPSRPR